MSDDLFSVYVWFPNGEHDCVRERVGAGDAVGVARDYTRPERPGVALGVIDRVTIVALSDDSTVFEWKHGEGVTFPPEARGRQ